MSIELIVRKFIKSQYQVTGNIWTKFSVIQDFMQSRHMIFIPKIFFEANSSFRLYPISIDEFYLTLPELQPKFLQSSTKKFNDLIHRKSNKFDNQKMDLEVGWIQNSILL